MKGDLSHILGPERQNEQVYKTSSRTLANQVSLQTLVRSTTNSPIKHFMLCSHLQFLKRMAPTAIPARSGAFAHLHPGQKLKISNPHGNQVVDTWAFTAVTDGSKREVFSFKYLSMIHTRSALAKLTLAANDILRDNEREPMLTLLEDTCDGVHCMLFAACDMHRYKQLGAEGHDSCGENLKAELSKVALLFETASNNGSLCAALASASQAAEAWLPDPVNLFMNVPVTALEEGKGGKLRLAPPVCPKGGCVVLKAEVECVIVMSACPMDLAAAGVYKNPGAEFEILVS
jgi:uncharacterized protein YcgI (DUF1989 family)